MRRFVLFLALLVVLPAAVVSAAAAQSAPVSILTNMAHIATDEQWQRIHDYIEQQTGVKYTFRDAMDDTSYTTQIAAAIAAQEPIDMFWIGNKVRLSNYRASRSIQDITDAINTNGANIKKLFTSAPGWQGLQPGEMWKCVTMGGRYWAVPNGSSTNVGVVLQIRKDWREKLGMAPITTVDQLEQYLRKVKATDLNGKGVGNIIPYVDLYGDKPLEGTASTLTYAFTGSAGWMHEWYNPVYKTPDGGIAPTILNPKFKDFLKRMRAWYKDGLLHQDVLSSTWDNGNDLIIANRAAAVSAWYSDFYGAWETLSQTVPTADYEIVVLKGIDGSPAKFTLNDPAVPGYGFTAWSKNVANGIKLMNWFAASTENYLIQTHGVPNVDWKWANKDANEITKTDPRLYAYSFIGFNPWNGVLTGTVTFSRGKDNAARKVLSKMQGVWWPDWFIAYDWKGTPIERGYNDASTFINEAISNYVLGRSTDADWDKAVVQYKSMWADEFAKQATAVFKAAK